MMPQLARIARASAVAACTALATTAIAASSAAPALASGLVKQRSSYPLEFLGSIDCGSFTDNYVDRYDVTEVDVFDADGNLLRVEYQAVHTSDDTNSVTGFTLHEHGHFYQVVDFVSRTITISGNREVANRTGSGVVIQDTGRIVRDLDTFEVTFFAGGRNHSQPLLGQGIWCDALS
jgi:hypothetical protein